MFSDAKKYSKHSEREVNLDAQNEAFDGTRKIGKKGLCSRFW